MSVLEDRLDRLEKRFDQLVKLMMDTISKIDERVYDTVQARVMKELSDAEHCDTYNKTGFPERPNRKTIWEWNDPDRSE